MSGLLDLTQLGLAPNQKHQALLGAPKIVHCGEPDRTKVNGIGSGGLFSLRSCVRNCKYIKQLGKRRGRYFLLSLRGIEHPSARCAG